MITQSSLLLLVFLTRDALSSDRRPPNVKSTSPKPKPGGHLTHISDFTDHDTGLNPFLDIPEGRTSVFGRRMMDRPTPNMDLEEGHPNMDRVWPKKSVQTASMQTTDVFDFGAYAEDDNIFEKNEEYAESPLTSITKFDDVEPATSKLETPFFVTLTALAIGVLVALIVLAVGVRWRRRTRAPSDVEGGHQKNSENSGEKMNTVDSPCRK